MEPNQVNHDYSNYQRQLPTGPKESALEEEQALDVERRIESYELNTACQIYQGGCLQHYLSWDRFATQFVNVSEGTEDRNPSQVTIGSQFHRHGLVGSYCRTKTKTNTESL